ncbi:MAG: Undecaprenyl-phosphate galactosephosphotransferase, partial [bacterium]|nr:Undecaprenyl-phosphate galactosephosphotransferase [bacterium]
PQIARSGIDRLGDTPMITFSSTPEPSIGMAAKRVADVMVALPTLLVLGLLLILPAAIGIKLTTRGPLFFGQRRVGRRGRTFTMWKLRSMVVNAERIQLSLAAANDVDGPVFKMKKDPRVTSIGRILRKLSIDELPQLWNVVKGEMSLVGPRPALPSEVAKYEPWQRRRLSVAPGLTCVWQTSGRNKIGFDQWIRMDLAYIDSWSVLQDVRLLLKTVPVVLTGYGAS